MIIKNRLSSKNKKIKWLQTRILLFMIVVSTIISSPLISRLFSNSINSGEKLEFNQEKEDSLLKSSLAHPVGADNFYFYKMIRVDHTKVVGTGSHLDFPLLISIFDNDLRFKVQPDGDDIAFAQDNQWLNHEIELFDQTYNATHAHLVAWVRIPSLSTSIDTNITMYYGNSTMESQENPEGVWESNYEAIYHLHNDFLDSSSNNRNGLNTGSVDATGKIGDGQDFEHDDSSDVINIGTWSVSGSMITIQAWVKYESFDSIWSGYSDGRILSKNSGTSDSTEYHVWMLGTYNQSLDSNGPYFLRGRIKTGTDDLTGTTTLEATSGPLSINTWYLATIRYDGSNIYLILDGNTVLTESKTGLLRENNWPITIGNSPTGDRPIDGIIDEVRVSSTLRSNNWLRTEYNNQNDPSSFYTVGEEQLISSIPPNAYYFTYYKVITTDYTKISGESSHVNFPLLISIFDSDLRYDVQSDGDDIAFALNDKWLPHEIEKFSQDYNSTHAQLIAWVRIPYLYPLEDMNITMYYGNSTMESQEEPINVWDSNYMGVWHLCENSGSVIDSSINGYDGIVTGASYTSSSYIDGGFEFIRAETDYIIMPNTNNEFQLTDFTVQAWIRTPDTTISDDYYIVTQSLYSATTSWALNIADDTGHENEARFTTRVSNQQIVYSNSEVTGGDWHHLVGIRKSPNLLIYVDGSLANSAVDNEAGQVLQSPVNISIGSAISVDSEDFNGIIDEVRISNIGRSTDWIATEYQNQYDPTSFYTIGKEQLISSIPSNADDFNYYKIITTDHTKISGENSHVNFPLLISIFDSDLRYDVQADGDDIAFAQNGKWLSHEIEKFTKNYNSTHAQLVVWVRVPYLYPLKNMNITMYYGNSSMNARKKPSDVWISNYIGVWHLKENPSETPPQIKDSSVPYSNGSSYGVMTSSDQVSGIIDGAIDFDGSNDYIDFGNPGELQITGEFTVQAWFKADNSIANDYLIAKTGGSGLRGWDISFDDEPAISPDGYIMFRYSPDGSTSVNTGYEQISVDQWYHVVGVFKPNEYSKFFLNGTEVAIITTGVSPSMNDPFLPLRIARRSDSDGNYFDGLIDEARVSNIARSNDWILTEYNNQFNPQSFYSVGEEQYAKEVMFADIQVNAIDHYGNLIPNVNISMYYYTLLLRIGISNVNGNVNFSEIPYGEYNFTVTMKSDLGNHLELVNKTLEAVSINESFQNINLICNVGNNIIEVEDIDGVALDSGWIIVGNSTHNLRNCTIDSIGKVRFWWVNTTPYEYNYTVYYQDNQYNPKIVKLTSGDINIPNSTIVVQVELTNVDFAILTFPEGEPISGIKIKLRLNDTFGADIVNLTSDQNGIASLRWLTSSGLKGNYSVQLEYYGENRQFNKTTGGPYNWTEYSFEVINKLSLEFRILISLADFQTELVSLNPNDYIEVEWGEIVNLRFLFNITKAGGATHLLGPIYAEYMLYKISLGGIIVQTGIFNQEIGNIGRHQIRLDTINLSSKTSYILIISAQKSGYSLPSNLILQLSVLENVLLLNQSENDDSAQSVYWLESTEMSMKSYGVISEEFTIQEQLFQDENHNFVFSLPNIENLWNISQVIFNIYNISWTVGPNDINITIIDPYGQFYMFHASNHTGENYLLGEWIGIKLNLNKNSPTLDNNFEFIIGGSFSDTVDIIADAYFIRDKVKAKYSKVNITDTVRIKSEAQGWAIKEIQFDLFNCYDKGTWSLINPLIDAHLNITTNEGFKYSLDMGYGNGMGSLVIDNRLIYPLSGDFLFTIESTLDIVFDVIIHVDYIQEFYLNEYLESMNSSLCINDVIKGGLIQINVVDNGWIEQSAILKINGINNGVSYFLPSELAMSITIGGQTFSISDLSRGYGTFSLSGYDKDMSYSAIITTNQEVDFALEFILQYSRNVNYEVIGIVSYMIVQAPSIQGNVPYDFNLGYYLQLIDTSLIDADNYAIRFTTIKEHYISAVKDLYLTVLSRLTVINGSSEFFRAYQTIYVKDALNFTFSYIDALTGIGINILDTFSYIWEGYDDIGNVVDSGEGTLMFKTNGIYSLDFDTEVRSVGEYLLIITLDKENYDNRNGMVLLTIEKRIFNYTLGENFKERQVSAVKGKNIPIELRILDPTKGNIPLENATICIIIEGVEYYLEEFENGTYIFTFSTAEIEAFFASKILTGVINISKMDYISQEFQITIMVGMEEIFPGFPTFYFLLIIIGIICFAGSITVYQVYKKAKIPKFVKKVRAIQKAIEREKEISAELLYREKAVYVGEIMKEYWDVLGLSLAEILGIEIKRTQKSDKAKRRDFTLEKQHEYRPVGLALMRWNERIGTEIIAKYPEEVQISDKSLMQIYSTHEYTGDKGIVTLMDGALNLVSYYTGPEQGYYLLLLLDLNDDPDLYESGMVDILQTILRNLQEESYVQLLPSLFQRLSVYPSYNEEQMFYYTYQNDIKRIIIHYLQDDGVIAKSELTIWLKDMYKEGFVDIDSALTELMKMGIIKQVSIKGLPSELLFLIKDIYMLRIPPIHLLKEPKKRGLPPNVVKLYLSEVKKFYENYKPSKEDNLKVVELLSLPQVYETFKLLRTSIVTMQDLEKLRKKGVEDIYSVLKQLWDNNMVKVFHDDQNTEYYALLSDFYVDYIFPKYVTRIIQNAYEQKSKADKILIEYLKVLEQTYFDLLKKS